MAEGDLIQQSAIPSREAEPGAGISDDAAASVAATAAQQVKQQARITAGRHANEIGSKP
jgi:hypothetical protein